MSQRPAYVEVGPLMTIYQVRGGQMKYSSEIGATEPINADLTALI